MGILKIRPKFNTEIEEMTINTPGYYGLFNGIHAQIMGCIEFLNQNKANTEYAVIKKLQTGETSITFTDEAIKESSTIDVYTDYYGINPKNVVVSEGKAVLTFKALSHDLQVKVVIK